MTVLVEKSEAVSKVQDRNETSDLVLDGGFVVPRDMAKNDGCVKPEGLVSNDEFIAPEINAFGQTFRFVIVHFFLEHFDITAQVN